MLAGEFIFSMKASTMLKKENKNNEKLVSACYRNFIFITHFIYYTKWQNKKAPKL